MLNSLILINPYQQQLKVYNSQYNNKYNKHNKHNKHSKHNKHCKHHKQNKINQR